MLALWPLRPVGADSDKARKSETKVTQTLSPATYKQMELAQKAFEAKDYRGAESDLDVLKTKQDKLNDYEKATLWNLYAGVFRASEQNQRAIEAYFNVLKQNQLPEGLRNDALFALAQMYFITDDYADAIKALNKWFAVATDPQPDAYVLLAQAYYQQKDYSQAEKSILKAMAIAKQRHQPFKENWLGLLRAVYFERKDYVEATKVMEVLAAAYPKDSYFLQLAGLYGLQNEQKKQAEVMHAAYIGGYINRSNDILNVARLYMVQDAPQRAVDLLLARLKDKTLTADADTVQLLAQAMALSRDVEQSIPVLQKLAAMTGASRHYAFLGQAYMQTGDWGGAARAFEEALASKDAANTDSLRMQLGTALYNDNKLVRARDTFQGVYAGSPNAEAAANWAKFITTEINRDEALRANAR